MPLSPPEPWEDKDNATIDGWTRRGRCNGCGYCCQFSGRTVAHLVARTLEGTGQPDWAYYEARDFNIQRMADGTYDVAFPCHLMAPCPQHDVEKQRCRIYETRPETCQKFPEFPSQVLGSPCSYWFERERANGELERQGGEGSPYPGKSHLVAGPTA